MSNRQKSRYRDWLVPYLEGSLDPQRAAQLEAHLATDTDLAHDLAALQSTANALQALAVQPPPSAAGVWPAVRDKIQPRRRTRLSIAWTSGLCAATLAMVGVFALRERAPELNTLPIAPQTVAVTAKSAVPHVPATPLQSAPPSFAPESKPSNKAQATPALSTPPVHKTAQGFVAAAPLPLKPLPKTPPPPAPIVIPAPAAPTEAPAEQIASNLAPAQPATSPIAGAQMRAFRGNEVYAQAAGGPVTEAPAGAPATDTPAQDRADRHAAIAPRALPQSAPMQAPAAIDGSAIQETPAPAAAPPPTAQPGEQTAGAGLAANPASPTFEQNAAAPSAAETAQADARTAEAESKLVWAVLPPLYGTDAGEKQAADNLATLKSSGQLNALITAWRHQETERKTDISVSRMLAHLYRANGDAPDSLSELKRSILLPAAVGEDWYELAVAETAAGDTVNARTNFNRALNGPNPLVAGKHKALAENGLRGGTP